MNRQIQNIRTIALAFIVLSISACQPTPEERLAKAEQLIGAADYRTAAIELRNVLQVAPDNSTARLLFARTSYQLGDFATAVSQYERALGLGEVSTEVWVAYGRALLSQGRARDALERVIPDLVSYRADEAVQVLIGDVLFAMASYDDANNNYANAVVANPTSLRGLIGQAMVQAAKGDQVEAQRLLDHVADIASQSSFLWMAQGNLYRSISQFEKAADAYELAAKHETPETPVAEHFSTRVNLVSSLIDSGSLGEATDWLADLQGTFPDHPVSGFLSGRLAFASGDYDAAQLELQEYLSKNPGDARGEAILGAINFSRDNLRQAEAHLIKAVRANAGGEATRRLLAETQLRLNNPSAALGVLQDSAASDQTDALFTAMLGRAQIAAGDTDEAIRYFEQSIEQEPNNPTIQLALATSYLKANRVSSAVELLDAMPKEAGSFLRRQTLLIAALARQKNHQRAIEESEELIGENSDDPGAYVVAGALWQSIGDEDRAENYYRQALTIEPDDLAARYSLGRMALAAGNLDVASDELKTLLAAHSSYVPAIVSLGMVLQRMDDLGGLRPYLAAAMKSAPDILAPHIILARLELTSGEPDSVLDAVRSARNLFPDEPELDHLNGLALLAKGENDSALRNLLVAAAAMPSNAAYRFDLAQAQMANEQYDAAFETAQLFSRLLPDDPRGPALIVDAAIKYGDPEKARDDVLRFAAANPDRPDNSILLGDIELASNNAPAAAAHYSTAASLRWNRTVAIRLARAYSVAGQDKATESLVRWLDEHADDAEVRNLYAQILESQGQLTKARSQYEALLENGQLSAIGLNNLAWQYSLEGNARAIELAREAHSLAPADGNITDTLGWILAEQGDTKEALPLLREAVEQAPDNGEIRFHLATVLVRTGSEREAKEIIDELLRLEVRFPSRADAERLAGNL